MLPARSERLADRLQAFGIGLQRIPGCSRLNAYWSVEKGDPVLKRPWCIQASNLDQVEALVATLERATRAVRKTTYRFAIPCAGERGTTAIVTLASRLGPADAMTAIRAAATTWARTPAGTAATHRARQHGWAFTLADLAGHVKDPDLQQSLRDHGIRDLAVDTVTGADLAWTFDDPVIGAEPRAAAPR